MNRFVVDTKTSVPALIASLESRGCDVRVMEDPQTKGEFFDEVKRLFDLDPPLVGWDSWDALSDSLWGGLDRMEAPLVALIWRGGAKTNAAYAELGRAVLRDVSENLQDATNESTTFLVVLAG
ncbi:MAG: barstar family protein [Myxococcota bacterium]